MASYAKRMRELAVPWLAANPDPSSDVLRLPREFGADEREATMAAMVERERGKTEEWTRLLAKSRAKAGDVDPKIREAERILAERSKVVADLEQIAADARVSEAEFSEKINTLLNAVPDVPCEKSTTRETLELQLGHWFIAWAQHGYNSFDLSQDFVAAMLLTDPGTLDITSVRLPFRGILMIIPSGFAVGAEGGHYTKIHVCNATIASASLLCITATDGERALTSTIDTSKICWDDIEALPDNIDDDQDRAVKHTIHRIVFGTLAYTSAVRDAMVPRAQPPRGKKAPPPSPDAIRQWEVGSTIKLDPELIRAARGGYREIALRIKSRFIVRGHYRNQAHGPQRSQRTSRWIAPFWKGPEEGAVLVHTYDPQAPKVDA